MAISHTEINSEDWTAITAVGESGTCWLASNPESGICRLYHSATGAPDADDIPYGYPVYVPRGQNQKEIISADTGSDIFYAIVDGTGTATIVTDVI
jgi:hypothetical protein